jgi:hypothetical protein
VIYSEYSDEQAQLDRKISTLKSHEKALAKITAASDSVDLANIREAITKLEKQ